MLSAKSKFLLVAASILIIGAIGYVLAKNPSGGDTQVEQTQEETEVAQTELPNLEKVNPEEGNDLLKRAGLPYENDRYAITYKENGNAPYGVTLRVIDKITPGGMSPVIRNEAIKYLNDRYIDEKYVSIEYESLRR